MKKKHYIWISAYLLFLMTACEKKLDPLDTYKDITVVYGLINPLDTIHYIRINKAFLTDGDVVMMAQDPAASTYPVEDIDVRIYEITPTGNTTQIPVETTIIHDKDSGVFYYPEQLVYYFKKTFGNNLYNLDNTIKIEIENKKTGKITYAETPLVNDFSIEYPRNGHPLDLPPNRITRCMWKNAKNGKIYDVYYTLYYREGRNIEPSTVWENDSLTWHIGTYSAVKTGNGDKQIETFQFNPTAFYGQIQKNVVYDTSLWRTPYMRKSKITVWSGGEALHYYHNINKPAQGVTQERPEYTNLKTKIYSEEIGDYKDIENEAFGIFSSRMKTSNIISLTDTIVMKYLPATDRQFHPVPVLVD